MKLVVQRVKSASVSVEGKIISKIGEGLLIFFGVSTKDSFDDIDWYVKKTLNMRIFPDENGKMNRSLLNDRKEVLVVPQFTLLANVQRGNRPSYSKAALPQKAEEFYNAFLEKITESGLVVFGGKFGTHMMIKLKNDGPVTIIIEKKERI